MTNEQLFKKAQIAARSAVSNMSEKVVMYVDVQVDLEVALEAITELLERRNIEMKVNARR